MDTGGVKVGYIQPSRKKYPLINQPYTEKWPSSETVKGRVYKNLRISRVNLPINKLLFDF